MSISPILDAGLSIGLTPGTAGNLSAKDSPEKVREAASQFEALLIGQILKESQQSETGWLGEEDQAGASAMDFAWDQFARTLASQGGLGMAKMISQALEQRPSEVPSAPQPTDLSADPSADPFADQGPDPSPDPAPAP